jgi:uncharacterized protein (TIGR02145 family)
MLYFFVFFCFQNLKPETMKKIVLLFITCLLNGNFLLSQVAINSDGGVPDNSAMLDVKSSEMGFLFPRLSSDARNAIPSPETGLLIYNTSSNLFNYYNGSQWCQVESSVSSTTTGSYRPGGGISIGGNPGIPPDSSAIVDINNPSRGVLIPRTAPGSVTTPVTGLIIYNNTTDLINYYEGDVWMELCATPTGTPGAAGTQDASGFTINTTGAPVDPSAILDVSSTDRGVLIPRLTEVQRDAILPAVGLTLYNLNSNAIEFYNGSGWYRMNVNFVATPAPGNHVPASTQITWKWHPVTGADGYKWNNVNDVETAIDVETDTSYTETGLSCESAYTCYVWAYNSCDLSDPLTMNQTTLTCCFGAMTDTRDGQAYDIVLIGNQCWMAESLNYGLMISHDVAMDNDGTSEKYCFDNDELNCQEWGALYQWDEAMQYTTTESTQGICPPSWHIPSEADWDTLDDFLGGYNISGGKMKESGYIHWVSPNTGASNSSGFTGIASGFIDISASNPSQGLYTHNYYWSSTEVYGTSARRRALFYFNAKSNPYYDLKWIGFSIRCVKD